MRFKRIYNNKMDTFELYHSADTQADLYNKQSGVHPDFDSFLRGEPTDPSSVDVSYIQNPSASKEEFLKLVFSRPFHVVYGSFGSNPFGPGNNILFKFDQTSNRLRLIGITQPEKTHELAPQMNVTSKSVTFTGGAGDLDILLRETSTTYKRQSSDDDSEPAKVYNLQAAKGSGKDRKIVYNYFVVPY